MRYEALHEVRDEAKVAELAEAMRQNGWVGAPLVVADDGDTQLLTGTHRIAAWRASGGSDEDVPTISLRALYEDAGMDWEEALGYANSFDDILYGLAQIADELPAEIKATCGIDCR